MTQGLEQVSSGGLHIITPTRSNFQGKKNRKIIILVYEF